MSQAGALRPFDDDEAVQWGRVGHWYARRPKNASFLVIMCVCVCVCSTQTAAVRKLRRDFKSGSISAEDYERAIDRQISYAIGVQVRSPIRFEIRVGNYMMGKGQHHQRARFLRLI